MKKVFLEGLKETMFVDENRYEIENRGIVDSIIEDTRIIFKHFGLPYDDDYIRTYLGKRWYLKKITGGNYFVIREVKGEQQKLFIFTRIVPSDDKLHDLYSAAHEDTHVLQTCGKLSILKKRLNLNLEQFDEETGACIGGLYGASKQGVNLDRIIREGHEFDDKESFFSAVDVYMQLRRD